MRLASIKEGNRVEADVKGRRFIATVLRIEDREVWVDPPRGFTYRRLTPRQIRRVVA